MKDAIEKVLSSGPVSFSRASSGCSYWLRPAANAPANVSRHRKGLLSECADTNVISKNAGNNQEDIDLRWSNLSNGCLRAFFFEGNCNDEMGVQNGVPTDVSYLTSRAGYGQLIKSNGNTTVVNCGSAADIDNLTTFSMAFLWESFTAGEGGYGFILDKAKLQIYTSGATGKTLHVCVFYSSVEAYSVATIETDDLASIVVTYGETGDKKIHIYANGVEVTYAIQTASAGTRISDAAFDLTLCNVVAGTYCLDGIIDRLMIWNRVLSAAEIEWVSMARRPCRIASTSAVVCFTFDDEFVSQYTNGKPVFDAQGVPATLYVCTQNIGASGYMTAAQILALQSLGWEIASHSKTHSDLTALTEAQREDELLGSKQILEALGCIVRNFAYPYGTYNQTVRSHTARYYKTGRIVGGTPATNNLRFVLPAKSYDDTGLEGMQAWVDAAEAGGYPLVMYGHELSAAKAAELNQLIDYIQAKGIPILTIDAMLEAVLRKPDPQVTVKGVVDTASVGQEPSLYGESSVRLQAPSASARQVYQVRTLSAEDYIVSFLAYKDGTAVTSADVVPFADIVFTNEITTFNYEHMGGGVYLCWGKFTATAASWNVGAEIKASKTVYLSVVTCVRAGTSMASGPYPRSPIANTSTGSATRQADSFTVSGEHNFLPDRGTLDTEFYPLFPSNLPNAYQFYFAHFFGGSGQMRLCKNDADKIEFRIQSNGDEDFALGSISWSRGDRVRIRVAWDCREKLDGTNYILMYGRVNEGPWTQIGVCATQPTPPSSDQTLYVGRAGSSAGYEANSFISWLRIYDRPLLNPSW
jgi:peptidoglycan/xylan/chitin deacetylase (PgdA/CDA1 family)